MILLGNLAFCSAHRPGQSDEAPLMTALANILGRNVDDGEAPALRRLHFRGINIGDVRHEEQSRENRHH